MGITKLNKNAKVDWGFNTEGFEFKKIGELEEGKVYPLRGCFTTPDKGYGVGAVLITDSCLVNIPNRYVDDVKYMMNDSECIDEIKTSRAGFKYSTYLSEKYKRTGYSIEFLNI